MVEGIPQTYPVLSTLRVDDENRIWAAVTVKFLETFEWWILDESGVLLAKLLRPRDETIYDIKNGYLYSKHTDETGVESIVRYRIELTER